MISARTKTEIPDIVAQEQSNNCNNELENTCKALEIMENAMLTGLYKYIHGENVIYIGMSNSKLGGICQRISAHSREPKFQDYLDDNLKIMYMTLPGYNNQIKAFETGLINQYYPILNGTQKDEQGHRCDFESILPGQWHDYEDYIFERTLLREKIARLKATEAQKDQNKPKAQLPSDEVKQKECLDHEFSLAKKAYKANIIPVKIIKKLVKNFYLGKYIPLSPPFPLQNFNIGIRVPKEYKDDKLIVMSKTKSCSGYQLTSGGIMTIESEKGAVTQWFLFKQDTILKELTEMLRMARETEACYMALKEAHEYQESMPSYYKPPYTSSKLSMLRRAFVNDFSIWIMLLYIRCFAPAPGSNHSVMSKFNLPYLNIRNYFNYEGKRYPLAKDYRYISDKETLFMNYPSQTRIIEGALREYYKRAYCEAQCIGECYYKNGVGTERLPRIPVDELILRFGTYRGLMKDLER